MFDFCCVVIKIGNSKENIREVVSWIVCIKLTQCLCHIILSIIMCIILF